MTHQFFLVSVERTHAEDCAICGEAFVCRVDRPATLLKGLDEHGAEWTGLVCGVCVLAGQAGMAARARERAEMLLKLSGNRIDLAASLTDGTVLIPTPTAYQRAADLERLGQLPNQTDIDGGDCR
jgi:hypothetical protein